MLLRSAEDFYVLRAVGGVVVKLEDAMILPCLCGANSTEIVQMPPLGAIVVQVLALTLNGGVAAGAVVNVMGAGLSLISVALRQAERRGRYWSEAQRFRLRDLISVRRLCPSAPIERTPYMALLLNWSCPSCFP